MPKEKKQSLFFCKECGFESSKWMGQCPGCNEWNSFTEEPVTVKKNGSVRSEMGVKSPMKIGDIALTKEERIETEIKELDRVLGGGIVPGSLILVGGDPGIGKSTLLLQVMKVLSDREMKVLYVSGEESERQIKMRADRIGEFKDSLLVLSETNLDDIEVVIKKESPKVVVIDSIQTMFSDSISSAPGSVSQVRETTNTLLKIAKSQNISIFIVGHVTKEGTVAGPRVLEHMVDTVLYFEGDRYASYRILRGVKNRFGSTNEIGVFEMRGEGLVEVLNPSEFMLEGRPKGSTGSVIVCAMEGSRAILIEIQALVCRTNFGIPRRQTTGIDANRVNLLMAVLEKRIGLMIGDHDAYVNVAGGIKLNEPGLDLGIVIAIVSSFKNRPVKDSIAAFGEIGLSGELRSTQGTEMRVLEAMKLGFKTCIVPGSSKKQLRGKYDIELLFADTVEEALKYISI